MAFEQLKERQSFRLGQRPVRERRGLDRRCPRRDRRGAGPAEGKQLAGRGVRDGRARHPCRPPRRGCRRRRLRAGARRDGEAQASEAGLAIDFRVGDAEDARARGRELRRRHLDVRRHVRARPGRAAGRARARDAARRPAGARDVDARRRDRPDVLDDGAVPAAAAGGCRRAARLGRPNTSRSCSATPSSSRSRAGRRSTGGERRGVLAVLRRELRSGQDAGRVPRRRAARRVPSGVRRLLRDELRLGRRSSTRASGCWSPARDA